MPSIGCDIDGVLASIVPSILRFHNKKYGTVFRAEDVRGYSFADLWKVSKDEEMKRILSFYNCEEFVKIPTVKGAVETVKQLSVKNKLVAITARPPSTKTITKTWLKEHFLSSFENIYFTSDYFGKGSKRKHEICKEQDIKFLIEDSLPTALECAKEGISVFLIDQPWNQSESLPENVIRLRSWGEIIKHKLE